MAGENEDLKFWKLGSKDIQSAIENLKKAGAQPMVSALEQVRGDIEKIIEELSGGD